MLNNYKIPKELRRLSHQYDLFMTYLRSDEYKWKCLIEKNILKENWIYNSLNETYHLHEPDMKSEFRNNIDRIINDIWILRSRKNYDAVFLDTTYPDFKEFIFNDLFPFIKTLKVYVTWQTPIDDGFSVIEPIAKELINPNYYPLLKLNHNSIDILSIFIYIPNKIKSEKDYKQCILQILPHELQHALDSIKDVLGCYNAGSLNEFKGELEDTIDYSKVDEDAVLKNQQINNINEFLFLISVLIYRTLKSEINAYLESFYNDAKNQRLNDRQDSLHYQYYETLYKNIDNILKNISNFQNKYKGEIKYILEKLKNILKDTLVKKEKYPENLFNTQYNFKHLLLFWKKRISNFLNRLQLIFEVHCLNNNL